MEGNGQLQAELVSQDALKIEAFTTTVSLEGGQNLEAEGSIDDLYTAQGVDLLFNARLHPEGQPPPAAKQSAPRDPPAEASARSATQKDSPR